MAQLAAGFVTLCMETEDRVPKFLVLRASNTGSWSAPKGYCEGESFEETASREFKEETGHEHTEFVTVPDVSYDIEYQAWGADKKVRYFLLLAKDEFQVTLDESEHDDYRWVSIDEYMKLHPGRTNFCEIMKRALSDAQSYVTKGRAPGA